MSIDETRQDLADAVGLVEGINGFPRRPSATKPGDAWVRWRGAVRGPGQMFEQRFSILIYLPQQDEQSADRFLEERFDELAAALQAWLFIDEFEPVDLGEQNATIYALMITGRTE